MYHKVDSITAKQSNTSLFTLFDGNDTMFGKGEGRDKSGFAVNQGAVNQRSTV